VTAKVVMPLSRALHILATVHTRDDDVTGFVVEMGAAPRPYLSPVSQHDYIRAWEAVRAHIVRVEAVLLPGPAGFGQDGYAFTHRLHLGAAVESLLVRLAEALPFASLVCTQPPVPALKLYRPCRIQRPPVRVWSNCRVVLPAASFTVIGTVVDRFTVETHQT